MKKTKIIKVIAIYICFALMLSMAACNSGVANETSEVTTESVETTIETTVETTIQETEETEPEPLTEIEPSVTEEEIEEEEYDPLAYDEYDEPVTMYGALSSARIHDGFGIGSLTVDNIVVNDEYEVVGENLSYYFINLDGSVYHVIKQGLSSVEIEDVEEAEEVEASNNSDSTTTQQTTTTAQETTEETIEYIPASDTPTYWTYNGYTVSAYEVEGVGTVYGYFIGTSGVLDSVNALRAEVGVSALVYSDADQSWANTRAIESAYMNVSHTRPNGSMSTGGEVTTGNTWDPVSAYNDSEGHRNCITTATFTSMSTASFQDVVWVPAEYYEGGGFWMEDGWGANVICLQ